MSSCDAHKKDPTSNCQMIICDQCGQKNSICHIYITSDNDTIKISGNFCVEALEDKLNAKVNYATIEQEEHFCKDCK